MIITYMWNLKYGTNEPISKTNRLTDIKIRLVVARGRGKRERWIGNLGLVDANYYIWNGQTTGPTVYSTGNYIQSPGINHNGKE